MDLLQDTWLVHSDADTGQLRAKQYKEMEEPPPAARYNKKVSYFAFLVVRTFLTPFPCSLHGRRVMSAHSVNGSFWLVAMIVGHCTNWLFALGVERRCIKNLVSGLKR